MRLRRMRMENAVGQGHGQDLGLDQILLPVRTIH